MSEVLRIVNANQYYGSSHVRGRERESTGRGREL